MHLFTFNIASDGETYWCNQTGLTVVRRPTFWAAGTWMQISLLYDPNAPQVGLPELVPGAIHVWLGFGGGEPPAAGEIRNTRHSCGSNFLLVHPACPIHAALRRLWGNWSGDYPLQLRTITL